MVATISSTLVTATARPHRIWLRSRALRSIKCGAARNNIFAEVDERRQRTAQASVVRAAAVQRQHVTAEIGLHRRETEQLVQHDFGSGVAFQLDHDAHTVAVGFVLDMGDAFDLFVAGSFGDRSIIVALFT